jgi:hypothetical protein
MLGRYNNTIQMNHLTFHTDIDFEIITIENLYTPDELQQHIAHIQSAHDDNPFTNCEFKNGKILYPELSQKIYERLQPCMPATYTDRKGKTWKPIRCAEYCFYSQVEKGQSFYIHTDTGAIYDEDKRHYSKFTLLTYLNDDYKGGKTTFYTDELEETVTIEPKRNKTLFFDIDLFHKGGMVEEGTKYWIGTEIVCELL